MGRRSLAAVAFVGLTALAGALALRSPDAPAARAKMSCGGDRWSVKTLTDGRADRIRLRPKQVSVAQLVSDQKPRGLTSERAKGRIELQVFRFTALLREAQNEGDGDIHLVVIDPRHPAVTMIAEFPSPTCTRGAPANLRRQMSEARAGFLRACGGADLLYGVATITGVGFWDNPYAPGAAPNGIELHPILGFTGGCSCGASTTTSCWPTPTRTVVAPTRPPS